MHLSPNPQGILLYFLSSFILHNNLSNTIVTVNKYCIIRCGGSSLKVVRLNRGSFADRAGPKQCPRRTQRLGGSGACPPRKVLNLRRSEINSDAFWDAFPAWQGTHTKTALLLQMIGSATHVVCTHDRSNSAQISFS